MRASPSSGLESSTGFYLHPSAPLHDPGWGHPEHQGRLPAIASAVGKDLLALHEKVEQAESRFASMEELVRVHPRSFLEGIESACRRAADTGKPVLVGPETPVSGASWDALRGSAGAGMAAVEALHSGEFRNAFVATRPPGHHASAERAMGFCAVNHVAVTARHLQAIGAAERVAIVDWDVHHGNGTQDIFYMDPTVHFLSLHQAPLFPGTGAASERGQDSGVGATLNVPLASGTSREDYHRAFRHALMEVEAEFVPDFVLVSAGYDALAGDPLGGLLLEPVDFHTLTWTVMEWAERACSGHVVVFLEGGYAPARTAEAVVETLRALAGLAAAGGDGDHAPPPDAPGAT